MASLSRSSIRQISRRAALVIAILISSRSARAQPAPAAAPATPPPPAAAPYGYAPRPPQLAAPRLEYPTYFYLPEDQRSGSPNALEAPKKRDWYGWQTLLIFGGSTTVGLVSAFGGGAADSPGVLITGLSLGGAGLLFGGPIVHWAHGNTGKGFGALGLNFGLPLLGAGLGVATACVAGGCSGRSDGFGIFFGLIIGGPAGLLTSMIVDVTVLSYEETGSGPAIASRKAPTWTILPDLHITREKTTFGFAGVF